MKRIILSVMVLAFAVAVQAADTKACQDKDKPACCPSKAKTSTEAKGDCPFAAKSACCKQAPAKQQVLLSPKAADAKQ